MSIDEVATEMCAIIVRGFCEQYERQIILFITDGVTCCIEYRDVVVRPEAMVILDYGAEQGMIEVLLALFEG